MNEYRRKIRNRKIVICMVQISLLFLFIGLWELFVNVGALNEFIVSRPKAT